MTITESQEVRQAIPMLRRWCPIARMHFDADEEVCGMEYCNVGRQYHFIRLRRMLVCSIKDCQQGYFSQKEFDEHECCSAY